jgi:hypothetical protein
LNSGIYIIALFNEEEKKWERKKILVE